MSKVHALGMTVIAEGMETVEQVPLLGRIRAMKCKALDFPSAPRR